MSDRRVTMARRTLGSILAIIGGLLLAVSAFLPWVKIGPGFVAVPPGVSGWETVSGIDANGTYFLVGRDGIIFLVGGVLIAALGLWTTLSRPRAAPILLILSGLAFGLLGRFEYDSIREGASNQCCDFATFFVGAGFWWIYAGAAATFLAGLLLFGQMRAGVAKPAMQGSPAVRPAADQIT
jgi:hypothetical protein